MKNIFNKLIAAPLAVLMLSTLALVPSADAREARGGGNRANVDNSRQDARSNNVRSASVNNVNSKTNNRNVANANANRNVNVNNINNVNTNRNVNGNNHYDDHYDNHYDNDCCNNGWDNPLAAAAVVTAVVVAVGTRVAAPPANANCVPVNSGGIVYQQCGSTWYQPQGGQYVVVNPPY